MKNIHHFYVAASTMFIVFLYLSVFYAWKECYTIKKSKDDKMNVLVVDDSKIMREIVKRSVSKIIKTDVNYLEAGDGQEALKLIESNPINLLLLDWNMPKLDGLSLVKELRSREEFKKLHVLMITSEAAKYNVIEAIKHGVNDYLIKPVTEQALQKKLTRLGL